MNEYLDALRMVITEVTESARVVGELDRSRAQLRRLAANLVATREELRPLMLDDPGLGAAIETLVHDSQRRMGITIALAMDPVADMVPDVAAVSAEKPAGIP